jgi:hypothetical protein
MEVTNVPAKTRSWDTGGVQPCGRTGGDAGKTLATSTVREVFETRQPGENDERIRNGMEEMIRVPEKTNAADEQRGVCSRSPTRCGGGGDSGGGRELRFLEDAWVGRRWKPSRIARLPADAWVGRLLWEARPSEAGPEARRLAAASASGGQNLSRIPTKRAVGSRTRFLLVPFLGSCGLE